MVSPQLIGPVPRSTPTPGGVTRARAQPLPRDLQREASTRLATMCLLAAAVWTVATLFGHVAATMMTGVAIMGQTFEITDAISLLVVVVSIALFVMIRRGERDPAFVLDLGLWYMVFQAFALGMMFHWYPIPPGFGLKPELSWIGVLVLMFAALVPNTPRKMAVASFVAVLMNPIGMLVADARGTWEFGGATGIVVMHYPDFIVAGVAVFISHVVMRLGMQIRKAREMGSYQLGELLGRGGMGEVYVAQHRMLARPAAIKLIRPSMLGLADDRAADLATKRFTREAEAVAKLRSPHTVELYDFGVTEDGTLYYVMELLEGMDLETMVRRHGPFPAARAVHALRQVSESLAEAHAAGLVHRDIKPANIHLGRQALRHDVAKVLDFGLVKSIVDGPDRHTLATAEGMTPGTPAYMAPETALGETVDGKADVYALGAVAHFLLTGTLVFEAENGLQMIARHLQTPPSPPSARAPAPVPPELDQLVLACLAKSPKDRPTALELMHRLDSLECGPWTDEDAARWWRDRPKHEEPARALAPAPVSAPV